MSEVGYQRAGHRTADLHRRDRQRVRAAAGRRAGGHRPEPQLDWLSNIIEAFNDQFGSIPWTDPERVHKLITEEIPARVAVDTAYQNSCSAH